LIDHCIDSVKNEINIEENQATNDRQMIKIDASKIRQIGNSKEDIYKFLKNGPGKMPEIYLMDQQNN
jgi:hypothetical protein